MHTSRTITPTRGPLPCTHQRGAISESQKQHSMLQGTVLSDASSNTPILLPPRHRCTRSNAAFTILLSHVHDTKHRERGRGHPIGPIPHPKALRHRTPCGPSCNYIMSTCNAGRMGAMNGVENRWACMCGASRTLGGHVSSARAGRYGGLGQG